MTELLHESLSLHNLPATVLLGLVLCYWLLVLIGLLDSDMDGVDINGDGIPDFADHHSDHFHSHQAGFWLSCGRFLHLGTVPLMIVLSVLSLSVWVISVLSNYYFNGEPDTRSSALALAYLVPNLIVSMLITRIVVTPLKKLFAVFQARENSEPRIIGREGIVVSVQIDDRYGQVEVATDGAPLILHARTGIDQPPIPRGTPVVIYETTADHTFHLVRPLALPEHRNS